MDCQTKTYFIDLCRLCLSEPGSCSIYDTSYLPRDIFVCTGVEVTITDYLPKKICNSCLDIINKAIDFRSTVSKNDLYLKSLWADTQEEGLKEDCVTSSIPSFENKSKYFNHEVENKQLQIKDRIGQDKNTSISTTTDDQTLTPVKLQTISIRKDLFSSTEQVSLDEESTTQNNAKRKKAKIESTEVLEYRCGTCCKNFETWKKLYLHFRLHNKNIACPIDECGKMFATKGDLEKHIRIHTGEKPYECNICQRGFAQKCSLKSHIETVHSDEDWLY